MTRQKTSQARRPLQAFLRRWHRRLGIASALFVLVLALTGITLNHDVALHLDQRTLSGPLISALYGPKLQTSPRAVKAGGHQFIWLDGRLFFDGRDTGQHLADLRGAVVHGSEIIGAGENTLLLFTRDGTLIEALDAVSLPGPIAQIGQNPAGDLVIKSGADNYRAAAALLAWTKSNSGAISWSSLQKDIPQDALKKALKVYRGKGVSAHRVLADIHSGRILGRFGPWLMDGVALVFIILAASGLFIWLRRRKNGQRGRG